MTDHPLATPTQRRLQHINQHLKPPSSTTTLTPAQVASLFHTASPKTAWECFTNLPNWRERTTAVALLKSHPSNNAWNIYLRCYRAFLQPYILDSFYTTLQSPKLLATWAKKYATLSEINVPLLKPSCLPLLSKYCDDLEPKGKQRYGEPRPSYPPGEWANYDRNDPRKAIQTDVNMTAIASRHMDPNDQVLWIYHSPHIQLFVEQALGCNSLYPYLSDLGIAANVMRPRPTAQTALGFHFDSVDSSNQKHPSKDLQPLFQQQKGVTGVIGLLDAIEGGERIVFPTVHREHVEDVGTIVNTYDPLRPSQSLTTNAVPQVESEATAGMLYLFDGGNVLHGVSSVRKGSRIALAFLYSESSPEETSVSEASADFFYKN